MSPYPDWKPFWMLFGENWYVCHILLSPYKGVDMCPWRQEEWWGSVHQWVTKGPE